METEMCSLQYFPINSVSSHENSANVINSKTTNVDGLTR